MSQFVINATNDNFSEIISADMPVLVDFYATWCGPCRMIAPAINEIAEELQGTATVAKLDIDACAEIAQEYGVMSVPTLMVFRNGEVVEKAVGARPKQAILGMLEKAGELA